MSDLIWRVKTVQEKTSLSRTSIYKLINGGQLDARRVCGRTYITIDSVYALFDLAQPMPAATANAVQEGR